MLHSWMCWVTSSRATAFVEHRAILLLRPDSCSPAASIACMLIVQVPFASPTPLAVVQRKILRQ